MIPLLLWLLTAHRLDISHIDLRENARTLRIVFDVDPHDLPLFERIDLDRDGVLSVAEVERQREALDALVAGRTEARARGNRQCRQSAVQSEFHAEVSMWHTTLDFDCPDDAQHFAVYFAYLDTLPRTHRAFVKISSAERVRREAVLGPKNALIDARVVDRWALFWDTLTLGIEHIITGLDHLLFVLALLLAAVSWREVVLRASMFTIAHSCTLALAVLTIVRVSPRVVEPLIALSIAIVALPLRTRAPLAITFVFGLLHGLGFASAIAGAFAEESFVLSLAGFNLGIETGQLCIVIVAWPLINRLPTRFLPVLRYALAGIGIVWAAARVVAG